MEVRKLYYEDCHQKTFRATVTACRETENGWLVALDATAFYPEGGGQACDLGTLNEANVLDVRETDGQIFHLCDRGLQPGTQVTGNIDWQRRFDLMQQHTGEHIVSGIIHRIFGYHNVGFHMGADMVTIDFDGPISSETLAQIEQEANAAVWQNLPVRCRYPSPEELPTVGYRAKRALPWPVRVVEVPGFDCCACCGVHVAATGEIGIIKLLSCVKFHQGVRLEMVCGGRALAYLSKIYDQNRLVSQAFSAKVLETGAAAQRMNEMLSEEKFRSAGLQKRVFAAIAQDYAGSGNALHFEEDLSPSQLRELAEMIAAGCGGIAAVFSGADGAGYNLCLLGMDAKTMGAEACKILDGRGGGKPDAFQGSVRASREQIKAFFHPYMG